MNSFISWIGGKKLLRNEIIKRFPSEKPERYIEVFGGAGWVLFGKESREELEVFNDIDSSLINLYRCLKYHHEELQKELRFSLTSREQFIESKEAAGQKGLTDIQKAARYYQVIKVSFGSDRRSFGLRVNNFKENADNFEQFAERLKRVVIENKDFESLIRTYDRTGALFYLDPPYVGTEKHYDNNFGMEDHIRLRDTLSELGGKFILSYNDDSFIRELYSSYNISEVSRSNNLLKKKGAEFKELIISNY